MPEFMRDFLVFLLPALMLIYGIIIFAHPLADKIITIYRLKHVRSEEEIEKKVRHNLAREKWHERHKKNTARARRKKYERALKRHKKG